MKRLHTCTAAIAIASLFFGTSAGFSAEKKAPAKKPPAIKENFLKKYNESVIPVIRRSMPMVVNISAIKEMPKNQVHEYDMFGNPLNKFPFKNQIEPKALGSGVIIDRRGYIVTNHHVIKDTRSIKITLSDRREFSCSVLGADPATDIAVIKIDDKVPADLPVIEMADSEKLEVGELVIAIGNPFGFSHTVTTGIVSATGRQSVGLADYEYFIQTDAAINPGNSGGALINIDGKLVGINTAIFSKSGGYMGIGFAIPANMVREVVSDLISGGKVTRGWLGVYIQDVTKDIAEAFKYAGTGGALVADIMKESPAEGSGLQKGDIITMIDGITIIDVNHLRRVVAIRKPGSRVKIAVFRGGKSAPLEMTIGTMPVTPPVADRDVRDREDMLGMVVKDIDEELAYKYRSPDRSGVIVTQVKPGSPSMRAGIAPGDVVKEIERGPIDSVNTYNKAVGALKGRTKVLLLINRAGTHKFLILDLEGRDGVE
ncbi:MAG: Do family serine endopeptidase [Spirochaetes bacterium]|nr:Do family serine endopeptidase [Spirochaetota bacterium]